MAMMRDFLISSEWRMDMKRMSTWGMPKPVARPHARPLTMVMMP